MIGNRKIVSLCISRIQDASSYEYAVALNNIERFTAIIATQLLILYSTIFSLKLLNSHKLLSVFGSGNHAKTEQENMPVTKSDDTLDDDDIDMDFIGG